MNQPVWSSVPPDTGKADPARLALLGHDLRAAVSDVLGGLRLIDHSEIDPATVLQLERVRAAGEVLARLLEDNFRRVLATIEEVFAEQRQKLLEADVTDLDVQIEVLTTQLKREGVV